MTMKKLTLTKWGTLCLPLQCFRYRYLLVVHALRVTVTLTSSYWVGHAAGKSLWHMSTSRTLSAADKSAIEKSLEHVSKIRSHDLKVSEHDLHDRFLKQARMPSVSALYDETSRDSPVLHRRPSLVEVPRGFTHIPAALKQAAAQLEYYHTFSGIFTQIRRAWMTIDHMLFLWDYSDPRGSFYQYDGLEQTILHAALVRPRVGVFEDGSAPQWLLLISTPVEVILLGLYTTGRNADIEIYETGFSTPSDGDSHHSTPLRINALRCRSLSPTVICSL